MTGRTAELHKQPGMRQWHGGASLDASASAEVGDYVALLKPRVMSLVIFTAFVGMLVAPAPLNPLLALASLLCISVGAGASGALNMWWDADIDALMRRTAARPIPAGRIAPDAALAFASILAVGSVLCLGLIANWLAAGLLAFTIFFYAVIYTIWLKRRTAQNIVIGGAAGALPPVIGWCAVTGDIGLMPVVLFTIIFVWTPPHFWALALLQSSDYASAKVPMLPVVAGHSATRTQILVYSIVLAPCALLPWLAGSAGPAYAVLAAMAGGCFVALALHLYLVPKYGGEAIERRRAIRLFSYSIAYLFVVFAALIVDDLWRAAQP